MDLVVRDDCPDQRGAVPPLLRTQRRLQHSATVRDRGVHRQVLEGKYLFHRLAFHEYRRDVPAQGFRERVNEEDWPKAFVKPDAPTLRGLTGLKLEASLGIDPGLEFAWRRDRAKALPAGHRMSESVVLSVPFIQLVLLDPLPVRPFIRP